jgi:alpha-1,6-mannosyltransferase
VSSGARRAAGRGPGGTIALLGGLAAASYAAYAALSYGMTPVAPFTERSPHEGAVFAAFADRLVALGPAVQAFVRGDALHGRRELFLALYGAPLVAASAAFVALLAALARHHAALDARTATRLARWATAFAALCALASPVLVQDFWLSAAWGRMSAHGMNPYYVPPTPEALAAIPLDYHGMTMTYGPLWAIIAAGVMWLAGGSVLLAGALFKLVLAGAWVGVVWLVRAIVRDRPAWEQCVAVAIAGWLPLGPMQIAGDGHNDVVMIVLVLAWLRRLEMGRRVSAALALAGSVLAKYISAPLFALDLAHHLRSGRRPPLRYAPQALAAALLAAALFAPFVRSLGFFGGAASMGGWHFYTPRDAVVGLGRMLGVHPSLESAPGMVVAALAVATQVAVASIAVVGVVRYWRDPGTETFRRAVASVVAGILLGVIGHLWPWFLVGGVAAVALVPTAALARWVVGIALAIPFPMLVWVTYAGPTRIPAPTVALYLFSLVWLLVVPRRWFAVPDDAPAPSATRAFHVAPHATVR